MQYGAACTDYNKQWCSSIYCGRPTKGVYKIIKSNIIPVIVTICTWHSLGPTLYRTEIHQWNVGVDPKSPHPHPSFNPATIPTPIYRHYIECMYSTGKYSSITEIIKATNWKLQFFGKLWSFHGSTKNERPGGALTATDRPTGRRTAEWSVPGRTVRRC